MAQPNNTPAEAEPKGFIEAMALSKLPSTMQGSNEIQRFISHSPAWLPGGELPWHTLDTSKTGRQTGPKTRAYGGNVYAQSALAAARAVEEAGEKTGSGKGKLGIHTIHGVFTNAALTDRPFIYEVATVSSSRSFSTIQINARQPVQASSKPEGPFPESDADAELGNVCLSCLTTFKRHVPSPANLQVSESVQQRYASILSQREPNEWDYSPQLDIDAVKAVFPNPGRGGFPIVNMHKVDMTAYNADKPPTERRELILYQLVEPIPLEDVNAHIVTHAFEADRNGLIMLGNHLGWGFKLGSVASLTYSFYVHVNAEDAVMKGDGWWIQEVCWPRVSAGRAMMECRIWSPEGMHVASGYQDGLCVPIMESKL